MPTVMDALTTAEEHIQEYQKTASATPEKPKNRFLAMLTSFRSAQKSCPYDEAQDSTRFETGIDILARTHPYLIIRALCG